MPRAQSQAQAQAQAQQETITSVTESLELVRCLLRVVSCALLGAALHNLAPRGWPPQPCTQEMPSTTLYKTLSCSGCPRQPVAEQS